MAGKDSARGASRPWRSPNEDDTDFLPHDSEAARLVGEFDWAATPLGPPAQWSASLRMIVRFLLSNRFPMLLWWGPDYIQIYNDPYIPVLGTKHPREVVGKPFRECWHEVYDVLGPLVDTPFNGGPATWKDDIELIVHRHGFNEESHFTIAYSPVPDETAPRGIGGVLAVVTETTEKVIGQRRLGVLSELGAGISDAKTDVDACSLATKVLAQYPKDVPFALAYLLDDAKHELRMGISACIRLDPLYTSFLSLVGSQVATAVANARAYEEERHRAEALAEADRQKNEFLAMLAHELRNPLAPIRNASELLARKLTADPEASWALAMVNRQVRHLTRLVDDLLDISRITQGRIELRRSPTRIEDVIARALETIDPLIREKHHRVAVVSSRRPLMVKADPERLVQCLANILANAAKYTNTGGDIRIESRTDGDQVMISVADNGVGIAPELRPKVFDLFVQAERTLDRSQGGLGIGLSIVKRLIEMHGGTVRVASDGVNRGATFEIRLPLMGVAQNAAGSVYASPPAPLKILVVDDNQDAADSLGSLLRLDGHDVETAYSGGDALDRIRSFRPAVVLLDIGLPGVDGYEVARRLRADPDANGTKLVALTGYGQDTHREKASAEGFVAHLVKPVDYAALQRVISQVAAD